MQYHILTIYVAAYKKYIISFTFFFFFHVLLEGLSKRGWHRNRNFAEEIKRRGKKKKEEKKDVKYARREGREKVPIQLVKKERKNKRKFRHWNSTARVWFFLFRTHTKFIRSFPPVS